MGPSLATLEGAGREDMAVHQRQFVSGSGDEMRVDHIDVEDQQRHFTQLDGAPLGRQPGGGGENALSPGPEEEDFAFHKVRIWRPEI